MRLVGLVRREHVNLAFAMHRVPEVQARAQLQIALLKHAFEQKYRAAPTQIAHPLSFVEVQQGNAVSTAQSLKHPLNAMAIGVCLDDGPDPRVGRTRTHRSKVMDQGLGADGGKNRARHGSDFGIAHHAITAGRLETHNNTHSISATNAPCKDP